MDNKKNTAAASNVNPNDASARLRFEAVVVTEGTVGGKAARVALYGTRYAACEVLDEGGWAVAFESEFGGLRGSAAMKKHLDAVAPATTSPLAAAVASVAPSVVAVLAADAEAFGPVGNPAVEVVPAAVEPEPVVEAAPAAVEPVLTTLDEVRAAFDAETRGACRASVLRALRVRAGEIALGLPVGGKIERAPKPASDTARQRASKLSLAEMIERGIVAVGDEVRIKSKPAIVTTIAAGALTADGRTFNQWASEALNAKALNVYVNAVHVKSGKLLDDMRGE